MRYFSNLEVEGWAVMSCLANGTHHTTNRDSVTVQVMTMNDEN